MKSIKYLVGFLCLAFVFFACEDDYERSAGGYITSVNPTLNILTQNEFVLSEPEGNETGDFLLRASWTRPRFSYSNGLAAEVGDIKYTLQLGILGEDFEQAVTVAETSELFSDIHSGTAYRLVKELTGSELEETQNLELRVTATCADFEETALISNYETIIFSPVPPEEPEEPWDPVELTIKFKQVSGNWEEFAVYAYGESEVYGSWPGQILTADNDGWYTIDVPTNRPINLIINNNNGGNQFDFLTDPKVDACYEFATADGNNTSTFTETDCPAPTEAYTIRFKQTSGSWEEFAVYAWGESEVYGGWPGKVISANDEGWYSFKVPTNRPINLIINNNNGGNQFDFLTDPKRSACYEFETSSGNNTSTFTEVDCPVFPVTIRWKEKNPTWSGMAIYAWGGSPVGDVFGGWPGKVVTADADGWYSVTLEPGQDSGNIIFNNNNGGIQIEPGPSGLTESACFIIDTEALSWEETDCP